MSKTRLDPSKKKIKIKKRRLKHKCPEGRKIDATFPASPDQPTANMHCDGRKGEAIVT